MKTIYYYIVSPRSKQVLGKSALLSWAQIKKAEFAKRGDYTEIYEVTRTATGTNYRVIK